jgi:hypothetical protein
MEMTYKFGTPSFDPFPEVTDVMSAAHCPVAALHNILHGRSNPLVEGGGREIRNGILFHEFASHLKSEIALGRRFADIAQIRYEFESFARHEKESTRVSCWQYYVEPWCRRKMEELSSMRRDANIFFEVHVANPYVPFELETGQRTYPLVGKVDEVNIDDEKLVERTTMGRPTDTSPPRLKDYQLWLLWKALCSIDRSRYPEAWRDVDFTDFRLIVETPYRDFEVSRDKPEFERMTHDAYSWIHSLLFGRRAIHEANDARTCTYLNKMEDCGLQWVCYGRRWPRPFRAVRDEMRREFGRMYLLLAYELLWSQHLFRYQLTMLNRQDLESLGLATSGRVLSFADGRLEMELEPEQMERFLAQRASGEIGGYHIVFGSFSLGVRLKGFAEQISENRVLMRTTSTRVPVSSTALLLRADPEVAAYADQPWFLIEWLQRDLFSLESWGKERADRADSNPTIRMLEAIFGVNPLRRDGSVQRQE